MKLLHVISSVDPAGGGPIESIKQLGAVQVSEGHQVEIASLDPPNAPYLGRCPLPVYPFGPGLLGYGFNTRLIPWLRANRSSYDVVVVNGIWQFHSFGTWSALRNSDTPYVLFTHGMLDPWFKKKYPMKHLKKWMYWPWAEYRVLRDASAVIFTCEEERVLARFSFWLYRCNEQVINYGTGYPTDDPKLAVQEFFRCYPQLLGKKLVLFMGRIHPKKGCDLLIEAFAKSLAGHPDWHLVFAGPDQLGWQRKLDCRASQLGVADRITWTGMISGALKWGALRSAEVFALPSHQENFGIAVSEALAAGVPVLISNKVNIWREIESDGAGMIAEDTLQGTCDILRDYVEMSTDKRLAMRERARRCFEQRFEITKAVKSFQAVLARVTGMREQPEHLMDRQPPRASAALKGNSCA
jgi:glycosyltransferase involved in cell wall biosynthesis